MSYINDSKKPHPNWLCGSIDTEVDYCNSCKQNSDHIFCFVIGLPFHCIHLDMRK